MEKYLNKRGFGALLISRCGLKSAWHELDSDLRCDFGAKYITPMVYFAISRR